MTTTREPAIERRELLLRAYLAYNAQDAGRLLTLVTDDVDWPDGAGGRMHGRLALAAYWTEQWSRVRTHDHPVAFHELDDGRVAVDVEQVVRSLDGVTVSCSRSTSASTPTRPRAWAWCSAPPCRRS